MWLRAGSWYCRLEFLQPELMLGFLAQLKNMIPQTQLLHCIVSRSFLLVKIVFNTGS